MNRSFRMVIIVIPILMFIRVLLSAYWPTHLIDASIHDDALFVKLASHIKSGLWLGPYDQLTHAKGAFFPICIAGFDALGIPLKIGETIVYVLAALTFSLSVRRSLKDDRFFAMVLVALIFVPIFWTYGLSRVVREPIYASETLLIFGCFYGAFLTQGSRSDGRLNLIWAAALGFGVGVYWLTREEGIWLAPALLPWIVYLVCTSPKNASIRERLGKVPNLCVVVSILCMTTVVFTLNALNFKYYGVFKNNDFRSGSFVSAYGALNRIVTPEWRRHIVVSRHSLDLAYKVSPAARDLQHYFETEGRHWAIISCQNMRSFPDCSEIAAGWFMWALRDAAASAGHYRSAVAADAFFDRLAYELNSACEAGSIPCQPSRATMVPPFRWHYIADALRKVPRLLRKITSIGSDAYEGTRFFVEKSTGDTSLMLSMTRVKTNLFPGQFDPGDVSRASTSKKTVALSRVFRVASMLYNVLLIVGGALATCMMILHARTWMRNPLGVLVLSLFLAVASRAALLCYLDVTSIPGVYVLYFAPAYPLCVAFAVLGLWLGYQTIKDKHWRSIRMAAPGSS